MDSRDNYGVKIIAISSAHSKMTQQARNTFNYWNLKIKSPTLQQIIIAFIPYNINIIFYLADCPQYFLCLKHTKMHLAIKFAYCFLSLKLWLTNILAFIKAQFLKYWRTSKISALWNGTGCVLMRGCGYNPYMSYKKKVTFYIWFTVLLKPRVYLIPEKWQGPDTVNGKW